MVGLGEIRTLADIVSIQARENGSAVAIKFGDRETTFAELYDRSRRVANALLSAGTAPGERVAVITKNHDAWFPLCFGVALARACLVPINCRLSAEEMAFIIRDAEPGILFVGEEFFDTALSAISKIPDAPRLVALHGDHREFEPFSLWSDAPAYPLRVQEPDDEVLQLYTSGTTGKPKGVVLDNRNFMSFLTSAADVEGISYRSNDRILVAMPLFHVAGTNISFMSLWRGAQLILVKDFMPQEVADKIAKERVTRTFVAPVMLQMMLQQLDLEKRDFSSLRSIVYGASPIADDLLDRARTAFGCRFIQFFAMTESNGVGTYLSPEDHDLPGKRGSCGKPWPHVRMAVLDKSGDALPALAIGEIAMRGDALMRGYWRQPGATAEALVDGWLHTGDLGYRDDDGYYFILDRVKDMIITGGENVYPAEVEAVLVEYPGVVDVAIVGIPDEKWGEAVMGLLVLEPGNNDVDPAHIISWSRDRIAHYKIPKSIAFVEALPRNAAGKLLRREIRSAYWEGRDRPI